MLGNDHEHLLTFPIQVAVQRVDLVLCIRGYLESSVADDVLSLMQDVQFCWRTKHQ